MPTKEVLSTVNTYLNEEPDDDKRAECKQLLGKAQANDKDALADLQSRFGGRLSFGTAGIRAKMEAGIARLNRVTVAKAAFAIGSWLKSKDALVVVGHDARLNSDIFAAEVSAILQGMGFAVRSFDGYVATPLCAFAVDKLKAQAGIMITASHNPPHDNGLKVYNSTGAQVTDSDAREIESYLGEAPFYANLKRRDDLGQKIEASLFADYLKSIAQTRIQPDAARAKLSVVYTPMHGVGYRFMKVAQQAYRFVDLKIVESQKEADGTFPTLPFPNPEEKGALDLAFVEAEKHNADLIVANDPDADRLAVALRKPGSDAYHMLSGNELGAILGCDVLENMHSEKKKLVITTLASSRLLQAMAQKTGAAYAESLTGFSRVVQVAKKREEEHDEHFIYAFEEALGYCFPEVARDKDGINAALHLLDRAALLKAQGQTLWDELDRIAMTYGLYRSAQWSFRFTGADQAQKLESVMKTLRSLKAGASFFDDQKIDHVHDLASEAYKDFPKANITIVVLADRTRIIVRPSGTEPKVKFYAEKNQALSCEQDLTNERLRLDNELEEIKKTVSAAFAHLH